MYFIIRDVHFTFSWWKTWPLWNRESDYCPRSFRKMTHRRATDTEPMDRILLWAVQLQGQWRSISTELSPDRHTGWPPHPSQRSGGCSTITKERKVGWSDNIPAELVQAGEEDVITALTTISNKIWQTGEWPNPWTQSLVITLLKKGNVLCTAKARPSIVVSSDQTTRIPSGSSYENSSKKRAKVSLVLDIFSRAIMNDLTTTFTPGLKMDAKCANQQRNWIRVATYFGTPPADWVHGYLYFEHGAWIWTKGIRRCLHSVKNLSGKFSLNSARVRALGWPLLELFSGFFWFFFFFFKRGLWGKSFIGNI